MKVCGIMYLSVAIGLMILSLWPLLQSSYGLELNNNVLISRPEFFQSVIGNSPVEKITLSIAAEYTGPQPYVIILQVVDNDGYIAFLDTKSGIVDRGGQFQNVTMQLDGPVVAKGSMIDIFVVDQLDNPTLFGFFKYSADFDQNLSPNKVQYHLTTASFLN